MESTARGAGETPACHVSKPYPFDGAECVSTAADLVWERPEYGADRFDVYFGTSPEPPFVCSQTRIVYDPGKLKPDTAYYWRVDAILGRRKSAGKVYRFTTGSAPAQPVRPEENGAVLLRDDFGASNGNWQPVYLKGAGGGSFEFTSGKMHIHTNAAETIFGVYNTTPVIGHFYAEVGYDIDDFAALALIRQKDGKPDVDNYVMISLGREGGTLYVTASDKQNGKPDILGAKQGVPAEQYRVRLDGTQFSVPFKGTAKRFRLMHEALWGSFRYLFKVRSEFKGKPASGWMETRGSPDWLEDPANEKFYVALLVNSGPQPGATAAFSDIRVMQKPTEDRDDTNTGFAVSRGEYNWSGFFDDAVVVTFGSEFPYASVDRKFVFWGGANDVPHWHMNNQALHFNEFVETWEDLASYPALLCFEPMSDRLRAFSRVQVVEDNAVRKVARWEYNIVDPNYRYPGDPIGTQAPEVVETYTFYRDGTITRKQRYTPKLDNCIRQQGNEVEETIVGTGTKTWYPDLIGHPATAVYNLEGDVYRFLPHSGSGNADEWNQFIVSMNFFDGLAPFVAYSNAADTPDVFPYPVRLGLSLKHKLVESRDGAAHWPVQHTPYENPMWSRAYLTGEASSWSFFSASNWIGTPMEEVWDLEFQKTYQIDERGRKYREWVSLVGMADVGDLETPKKLVRSWLYPGSVEVHGGDATYEGNNRHEKCLVFRDVGSTGVLSFSLAPRTEVVNPAVEVRDWAGNASVTVKIDGVAQMPGADFVADMQGASLLLWFRRTVTTASRFEVVLAAQTKQEGGAHERNGYSQHTGRPCVEALSFRWCRRRQHRLGSSVGRPGNGRYNV